MHKVDILAFGAHPDDVELGCSGTILLQLSLGYKVGVVDLTKGELGTRGNAKIRLKEANIASQKMGVSFRENLNFLDGFFENNKNNKLEVIKIIRLCRPDIILCNTRQDRHPDHGNAANLINDASFLSGLVKIKTKINGNNQEPYRPNVIYNYLQYNDDKPDFIVDISAFMNQKMDIIRSYKSQFYNPNSKEQDTIISKKEFLESVVNRCTDLGRFISVDYAEGFLCNRYLGVNNLNNLL